MLQNNFDSQCSYHIFHIKRLAVNETDYRGSKLRVNVIPYLCHYLHFFNYCFQPFKSHCTIFLTVRSKIDVVEKSTYLIIYPCHLTINQESGNLESRPTQFLFELYERIKVPYCQLDMHLRVAKVVEFQLNTCQARKVLKVGALEVFLLSSLMIICSKFNASIALY